VKAEKTKQWDLTEIEIAELTIRRENQMGRVRLLEALQRQLGMEAKAEIDWWEKIVLRLKIPAEYRYRLIADERAGKAWVKGEVKELDNQPLASQDNPYS